jgi:hypothetical protein
MVPCRSWTENWRVAVVTREDDGSVVNLRYRLRAVALDQRANRWWWDVQFSHDHNKPVDFLFAVSTASGEIRLGRCAGFRPSVSPTSLLLAVDAGTNPMDLTISFEQLRETTL